MENRQLPSGVSLSDRPLRGKRVIIKGQRKHANQRSFTVDWPEANQQEMALPKLACVVSGTADYLLGNYCLHASEGTFILIPPHTPHHRKGPFIDSQRLQNRECTLLFAYAYEHGIFLWFSRSLNGVHTNNMADNYLIPNVAAVQLFNLLMTEAVTEEAGSKQVCRDLLSALFTILAREIETGRCMSPVHQERMELQTFHNKDFAGQVQEYIRASLHKHLKVEEIAAQFYMSSSHFSRMLRQKTGVSFVELLTRCRIERAKELLKETDWTVTYITDYVGLKSTAYFHGLFLRRVGCSPIEYRQQYRK